jgi:hypothetical protein
MATLLGILPCVPAAGMMLLLVYIVSKVVMDLVAGLVGSFAFKSSQNPCRSKYIGSTQLSFWCFLGNLAGKAACAADLAKSGILAAIAWPATLRLTGAVACVTRGSPAHSSKQDGTIRLLAP